MYIRVTAENTIAYPSRFGLRRHPLSASPKVQRASCLCNKQRMPYINRTFDWSCQRVQCSTLTQQGGLGALPGCLMSLHEGNGGLVVKALVCHIGIRRRVRLPPVAPTPATRIRVPVSQLPRSKPLFTRSEKSTVVQSMIHVVKYLIRT